MKLEHSSGSPPESQIQMASCDWPHAGLTSLSSGLWLRHSRWPEVAQVVLAPFPIALSQQLQQEFGWQRLIRITKYQGCEHLEQPLAVGLDHEPQTPAYNPVTDWPLRSEPSIKARLPSLWHWAELCPSSLGMLILERKSQRDSGRVEGSRQS